MGIKAVHRPAVCMPSPQSLRASGQRWRMTAGSPSPSRLANARAAGGGGTGASTSISCSLPATGRRFTIEVRAEKDRSGAARTSSDDIGSFNARIHYVELRNDRLPVPASFDHPCTEWRSLPRQPAWQPSFLSTPSRSSAGAAKLMTRRSAGWGCAQPTTPHATARTAHELRLTSNRTTALRAPSLRRQPVILHHRLSCRRAGDGCRQRASAGSTTFSRSSSWKTSSYGGGRIATVNWTVVARRRRTGDGFHYATTSF